jgi:hypothetical protein
VDTSTARAPHIPEAAPGSFGLFGAFGTGGGRAVEGACFLLWAHSNGRGGIAPKGPARRTEGAQQAVGPA